MGAWQPRNDVHGSELLVKWVLIKKGYEAGAQSGSYKIKVVKFYKKRGKGIWKNRFTLQRKKG